MREGRKCLADVRSADHDDLGVLEVRIIVRPAVQTECLLVPGAGADHTKPAVVVQIARLKRDSRKLSDKVALLVC